jgi:hypothetical protein
MRKDNLEYLFSEQLKLTLACLFLYLVFAGVGYAGLIKTATLNHLSNIYLIVMAFSGTFSVVFFVITIKSRRATGYLLLSVFQLMPILLGSLCLIAVSIGNVLGVSAKSIFFLLSLYICISTLYVYKTYAHGCWESNIKIMKYDLKKGLFYPYTTKQYSSNGTKYKWFGDFLFLVIVFILMIFRNINLSQDYKLLILCFLCIGISFFITKFIVNGLIYPLIQIIVWESNNKNPFMIAE